MTLKYRICGVPINLYRAREIMSMRYQLYLEHGYSQDIANTRNELYYNTVAVEKDRLNCIGVI